VPWTWIDCLVEMFTTAGCSREARSAKLIGAPGRGARGGDLCRARSARLRTDGADGQRRGGSTEQQGGGYAIDVTH
jgi:hypothetical protein